MDPRYVTETLDSIQPDLFKTDAERFEAMEAARRLVARLETPFERIYSLMAAVPGLIAGLQVCQNLGIWKSWTRQCRKHGNGPQSLDDILAKAEVPIEPNLLRRLLRHLSALHTLEETGVDEWKLTPFTTALGDEALNIDDTLAFGMEEVFPAALNLAPFLAKRGHKEPLDSTKGTNFADVFGDVFFSYCQKNPAAALRFQGVMTDVRDNKMDWTEVYDTSQLILNADLSEDAPALFVDIGGMHGVDTTRLLAKHPDLPQHAKLVVQDLPEVVEAYSETQLDSQNRVSRMAYDFFTPQPLLGARAYFFHAVPHDWADAECVKILENVKLAMKRGYSKLLIYEMVIPAKGAPVMMTGLDMSLMNLFSGLERTEVQWSSLLGGLGFRIAGISRHPMAVESVIEAELP